MHFASPYYLWLLTLLVPMIGYYVWRTLQGGASIQISSVAGVVRAPRTVRYYLRHLPFALRAAAFALLVVALVLLLLEFVVLDRRNPLLAHLNIFREK